MLNIISLGVQVVIRDFRLVRIDADIPSWRNPRSFDDKNKNHFKFECQSFLILDP